MCTRAKCARGHEHEKRKLVFVCGPQISGILTAHEIFQPRSPVWTKEGEQLHIFFSLDNRTTRKQEIGKVRFGQLILCNRPHSPPVYRRNKLTRHVRRTRGQACKSRVGGDEWLKSSLSVLLTSHMSLLRWETVRKCVPLLYKTIVSSFKEFHEKMWLSEKVMMVCPLMKFILWHAWYKSLITRLSGLEISPFSFTVLENSNLYQTSGTRKVVIK